MVTVNTVFFKLLCFVKLPVLTLRATILLYSFKQVMSTYLKTDFSLSMTILNKSIPLVSPYMTLCPAFIIKQGKGQKDKKKSCNNSRQIHTLQSAEHTHSLRSEE